MNEQEITPSDDAIAIMEGLLAIAASIEGLTKVVKSSMNEDYGDPVEPDRYMDGTKI